MNEQFEKLHAALRSFGPFTVSSDVNIFSGKGATSGSFDYPQSTVIQYNIADMYNYFGSINLVVYEDILLARDDKAWVNSIQSDFNKHIEQIKTELEMVKSQYKQYPNLYPFVKTRPDGDLIFYDYFRTKGSYLGNLLTMNIVDYLNSINKRK